MLTPLIPRHYLPPALRSPSCNRPTGWMFISSRRQALGARQRLMQILLRLPCTTKRRKAQPLAGLAIMLVRPISISPPGNCWNRLTCCPHPVSCRLSSSSKRRHRGLPSVHSNRIARSAFAGHDGTSATRLVDPNRYLAHNRTPHSTFRVAAACPRRREL